jgi:hypothetical protein
MCGAIELDPGDKYSVSIVASLRMSDRAMDGRRIDTRPAGENHSLTLLLKGGYGLVIVDRLAFAWGGALGMRVLK